MRKIPMYNIKSKDPWFKILLLGDFHYGHNECDDYALRDMIHWIAGKDPRTHGVILTGDNTENVLPSSKGSAFDLKIPDPKKQIEGIAKILKPIAPFILAMYDGNHSYRSQVAAGYRPDEEVAKLLGLESRFMGYSGYFRLALPQKYLIWGEHGSSNSRTASGKIRVLTRMAVQHPGADLYVQGHIHHKFAIPDRVEVAEGNYIRSRKIIFAANGSYLMGPEYAQRLGFTWGGPGAIRLELNATRKNIHAEV